MDICPCFKYTNALIFSALAVKRSVIGVYMKRNEVKALLAQEAEVQDEADFGKTMEDK
jgi:hypothetical protein